MLHGDLLGERAALTPNREALVLADGSLRLTWGELDARARKAAAAMLSLQGIAKGERLGILSPNSAAFVEVFFAAGKSGVILVPLSTRATAHELEGIVRDSGMAALLCADAYAEIGAQLATRCPTLRVLSIEREWLALRDAAAPRELPLPAPEDLYALLYTSGTTGKPKGVMIPHRMIAWNAYNTAINWGLRDDDKTPVFTPLYHAGGLTVFLTPLCATGGAIVLHDHFDPEEVWSVVQRERCTIVFGVPTIWKVLSESPQFATADLSHIRWLISGGAPLPAWIIAKYQERGLAFKQGFGMTEVGVNCFSMTVEDSIRKPGSIGKPMLFTRARLTRDDGSECAPDEVGELWLRGPHVAAGYWNQPEATAASFLPDGWFRTGDSARRDEEGFYTIAGRKKDMFISGGVNVYPAEIEGELVRHPSVADAAVLGVDDSTWGEVGVAFIVPKGEFEISALESWLGERLSRVKLPKRWMVVEALPRTPYGKVEKQKLKEMLG